MNAKKCKALRRALRQVVAEGAVAPESRYEIAKSGHQRRQGLDGNFAFRTWYVIKLADCARARYKAAKKELARHV